VVGWVSARVWWRVLCVCVHLRVLCVCTHAHVCMYELKKTNTQKTHGVPVIEDELKCFFLDRVPERERGRAQVWRDKKNQTVFPSVIEDELKFEGADGGYEKSMSWNDGPRLDPRTDAGVVMFA
jgi:hypothetical protein